MSAVVEFNLDGAMRGEAIQTIEGLAAQFIAYAEDAHCDQRGVVLIRDQIEVFSSEGKFRGWAGDYRLVMAPSTKKVWINMYEEMGTSRPYPGSRSFSTREEAESCTIFSKIRYFGAYEIEVSLV